MIFPFSISKTCTCFQTKQRPSVSPNTKVIFGCPTFTNQPWNLNILYKSCIALLCEIENLLFQPLMYNNRFFNRKEESYAAQKEENTYTYSHIHIFGSHTCIQHIDVHNVPFNGGTFNIFEYNTGP